VHSNPTPGVTARIFVSDTPNSPAYSPTASSARSTQSTRQQPAAPHPGGSSATSRGLGIELTDLVRAHARTAETTKQERAGSPIERPRT
jgi:hypothetical protein